MFVEETLKRSYSVVRYRTKTKMRLSMVVELLLILLLVAFAAYGRVIGNDFPRFFFFFFFFKIVNANSSNGLVISLEIVGFLVARKGNV